VEDVRPIEVRQRNLEWNCRKRVRLDNYARKMLWTIGNRVGYESCSHKHVMQVIECFLIPTNAGSSWIKGY